MDERKITVYGVALPQGSKSGRVISKPGVVNGKATMTHKAILTEGFGSGPQRRKLWREAVANAAREWLLKNGAPAPLDGAIEMEVTFFLPRPLSTPKRVLYPTRKPDVSKLVRAVEDSMSKLLYVDDARIIDSISRKRFAVDSPPRAEIVVRRVAE